MTKLDNPSLRLSKNFTLREAVRSQTASRCGIDNRLPEELLPKIINVAENILQPCRDHFAIPFSPSSFYRSIALCQRIGSTPRSQHAKGEAVDFEIPTIPNLELAEWIADNLEFDQLILEFHQPKIANSGWVHCSLKEKNNRKQFFMFDGKRYVKYSG